MPNILEGKLKLPETMDFWAIPVEVKIKNKMVDRRSMFYPFDSTLRRYGRIIKPLSFFMLLCFKIFVGDTDRCPLHYYFINRFDIRFANLFKFPPEPELTRIATVTSFSE